MASLEPSEEEIGQVIDFASLDNVDDRFMVSQALKNNNRNVETVVMQFFDNPDSFRQKYQSAWDDSMFTADREGNNNTGISFHVESPDHAVIQGVTPPSDSYAAGAPSRPPSRSNNRSPMCGVMDGVNFPRYSSTSAADGPSSHDREDEEMQRALRESAQEAGITMPQSETGVTEVSATAPHFGPASRSEYDQNNWAMVPVGPSQAPIADVPPPSMRKRVAGGPVLLLQGNTNNGQHRLGGLLTILHEIPLARNILLSTGEPAQSYGHNSEWWKGQEILSSQVLAQMSGELQWQDQEENAAFEEEIHRLMAFLDSTERSYGSVAVLTNLVPFPNMGAEKQFYDRLGTRNLDVIQPLMQVASLAQFHGEESGLEDARFAILEMEHLRSEYSSIKTLYESLDHVMWSDVLGWNDLHDSSKMALMKKVGELMVFSVAGDGPEDSIEIPLELYPERYLASRKDEARRIQIGWCKTKREMARIQREEERIFQLQEDWASTKFTDKRDLIKKSSEQWGEYKNYLEGLARFQTMEESNFDTNKYPDYRLAPCNVDGNIEEEHAKVEEVIRFSEQLLASLEAKVKGLHAELEVIKARQRALGRLLTDPDKPDRPIPMTSKKLLLRGVATSTDVVYVCQRSEGDLIDLGDDAGKTQDQWWRLAYVPNDDQPIKIEKIEVERVLRDMWQETKTPILVYATEEAINAPREPLTSQLERFVRADNKAFRQELNQEKSDSNETRRAAFVDPISPSKRKHRSDSADSMDSNRASLGSDDRNVFDNPFSDQDDHAATEMKAFPSEAPPAYVESFDTPLSSADENQPAPPAPQPTAETTTQTTSATMTPNTVATEHTENVTPATEEVKSPEMQERARPPSFMTLSRNPSATKESSDIMNMEIPEHRH